MEEELVFEREIELEELLSSLKDPSKIKVVVGLRGAGKTFLLNELFYRALLRRGYRPEDIFKADLSGRFASVRDVASLQSLLKKALEHGAKLAFIDEIQLAGDGYADALISFAKNHPGISLFVTGSNSKTLSDDIRKAFKEKAEIISLRPLSFKKIREQLPNYDVSDYLHYGGLPIALKSEPENRMPLLDGLYQNTYLLDIKERFKSQYLSNIEKENILIRMLSNLTSPLSESQIIKGVTKQYVLNREQLFLLKKEILDFIETISSSFLVCDFQQDDDFGESKKSDFLDHHIKKYCFDLGLLNLISDAGKTYRNAAALENGVYLELLARGICPHGGSVQKANGELGEIDFVFDHAGLTYYVQSVYTLDEDNRDRELNNLLMAPKSAQKLVIFAVNNLRKGIPSSIKAMSFEEFLLGDFLK